jgi:hypothetical protein
LDTTSANSGVQSFQNTSMTMAFSNLWLTAR